MTTAITNRHGEPILTVEDWGRLAKPASKSHWKDGRSAKELAKAWVSGEGEASLKRLFDRYQDTAGLDS